MKTISLGLIGTGGRGVSLADRAQSEDLGLADVTALADINPVRLRVAAEDLEVSEERCFEDYRQMLERKDLDAVIVATPDNAHAEPAIAAVQAGLHVYCEKGMATTVSDASAMVEAVEEASDLVFYAGHNMRFGAACARVNAIIQDGEIGDVHMVWGRRFVEGSKYWHRWHRYREKSGGLLVHKGSHVLDLINWNSGSRPAQVAAFGGLDVYQEREDAPRRCLNCPEKKKCLHAWNIEEGRAKRYYRDAEEEDGYIWDTCIYYPGSDVFDNATVNIQYQNGVRGTYMECHFAPISDNQTEVGAAGDKGLVIGYPAQRRVIVEKTGTKETAEYSFPSRSGGHGGADEGIIGDFLDCILTGRQPESDVYAGWDSAVLGIAAQKSAEEGRMIALDPGGKDID